MSAPLLIKIFWLLGAKQNCATRRLPRRAKSNAPSLKAIVRRVSKNTFVLITGRLRNTTTPADEWFRADTSCTFFSFPCISRAPHFGGEPPKVRLLCSNFEVKLAKVLFMRHGLDWEWLLCQLVQIWSRLILMLPCLLVISSKVYFKSVRIFASCALLICMYMKFGISHEKECFRFQAFLPSKRNIGHFLCVVLFFKKFQVAVYNSWQETNFEKKYFNFFTTMGHKAMSTQNYKKLLPDPCLVSWSILLKFKFVGVLNIATSSWNLM